MSENFRFLWQISGVTSLILLVTIFFVNYFGSSRLVLGVFYGYLVSLINILFAFFSIKWAFDKSNKTFFTVILGGMGMRLMILLSALFFVWRFVQIPLISFVISLMGFYLTLQFFEIRFIQRELNIKKTLSKQS